MALKNDTEQIINLTLEPVRYLPQAFDGSNFRIVARQIDLENDLMVVRIRKQMVNDLDFLFFWPIERGQIRQHLEIQTGTVTQKSTYLDDGCTIHRQIGLQNLSLKLAHFAGELFLKSRVNILRVHSIGQAPAASAAAREGLTSQRSR